LEFIGVMNREAGRRANRASALAKKCLIAACCCLSFWYSRASAQENAALFAYGDLACDEWIRDPTLLDSELRNWVLGYIAQQALSGGYRVNISGQMKSDEILKWVDGYCRMRPLDGLAVAAMHLTNELAARAAAPK
jgi:hypothetical protein